MITRRMAFVLSAAALALVLTGAERSAFAEIGADELQEDMMILASDRMEGRMTGEPGQWLAAEYLERRFAEIGLKEAGDDGYLQRFDVPAGRELGDGNRIEWGGETLRIGTDAQPGGASASGAASAPVVFVGYGICEPDRNHDDYAGLDVTGKIVLVLSGFPGPSGNPSRLSRVSGADYKLYYAQRAGAVGAIYVRTPEDGPGDALLPVGSNERRGGGGAIPFVSVSRAAALQVLPKEFGPVLAEEIADCASLLGRELPAANLTTDLRPLRKDTANVVGILPGSDPARRWECVVVGAHYDHIGYGTVGATNPLAGKAIHNGADDNASGAIGVLHIAEELMERAEAPRRTIVFVCFSGEEIGLLGSRHYVSDPVIPLERTSAMVNLDMIGRLGDDSPMILGADSSPDFEAILKPLSENHGLDPRISGTGLGSDHQPFVERGVPALFFFTGIHKDYHTPTDDWPLINYEGEAKILGLVTDVVLELANRDEKLEFSAPQSASGAGGMRGARAFVGIVPDVSDEEGGGYRIAGVSSGSPAASAGLQPGDVIRRFAGAPIGGIDDFTKVLSEHAPGDEVEVEFVRGEETRTVTLTLGTR